MKYDAAAAPMGPTPQQFADLGDLLITAEELYVVYNVMERSEEVVDFVKDLEFFSVCRDQAAVESETLRDLIEYLRTGYRTERERARSTNKSYRYEILPDIQVPDATEPLLNLVKRAIQAEALYEKQLSNSLTLAQSRHQVKMEFQLKTALMATIQRQTMLDDRFGAELTSSLLEGLKRKTSRLFNSISRTGRLGLGR